MSVGKVLECHAHVVVHLDLFRGAYIHVVNHNPAFYFTHMAIKPIMNAAQAISPVGENRCAIFMHMNQVIDPGLVLHGFLRVDVVRRVEDDFGVALLAERIDHSYRYGVEDKRLHSGIIPASAMKVHAVRNERAVYVLKNYSHL